MFRFSQYQTTTETEPIHTLIHTVTLNILRKFRLVPSTVIMKKYDQPVSCLRVRPVCNGKIIGKITRSQNIEQPDEFECFTC